MKKGARIIWIDESAFYLLPFVSRTYAPSGQTPVLKAPCSYDHLSAISAITIDGHLYFDLIFTFPHFETASELLI